MKDDNMRACKLKLDRNVVCVLISMLVAEVVVCG